MAAPKQAAVDKRRLILDAAVRVFAREGFHACRVSDIANEAGVAYGLVYHYFKSKDQVLDTLFLERWDFLLEAIRETDRQEVPAEQKLTAIAGFIIESYRHDPDLMKVIIVEVTRAANTFGATHIGKIGEAYALIRGVVEKAQQTGEFRSEIPSEFAVMAFYGAIEQVLTGWIFGLLAGERRPSTSWPRRYVVRTDLSAASPHRLRRHDRQRSRQAPGLVRPARRNRRPGLDRDHPRSRLWYSAASLGKIRPSERRRPPAHARSGARRFDEEPVAPPARLPSRPRPPRARPPRRPTQRPPRARRRPRPSARGRGARRGAAPGAARDRRAPRRGGDRQGARRGRGRREGRGEALAQGAQGQGARRAGRRPRPSKAREQAANAERLRPREGRGRKRTANLSGANVMSPGLGSDTDPAAAAAAAAATRLRPAQPAEPGPLERPEVAAGVAFASAFLIARILKRLVD